jgi:hypothetical protein
LNESFALWTSKKEKHISCSELENKICGTGRLSQGYIIQNINNKGSIAGYKAVMSIGRVRCKRWSFFSNILEGLLMEKVQ